MIVPPAPYSYTGEVITVSIPTLSGTYTYNGNSQTPVWNNLNESAVSLFGQTEGVNAGSYQVTFSLNSKRVYKWSDGTTDDKTATWTINKAQNIITFEPTSLDLTYYEQTGSFVVSYLGNGQLSYQINNDKITATQDGNTLNVHAVKTGDSTITVNVSESANYLSATATFNVSVDMAKNFTVTLNVDEGGGGTVSGAGTVKEGNSITVTATAFDGYKFAGWESNGEVVSTAVHYTFTPTSDITLTAVFEEIPVYSIIVNVDPTNGGTVTGAGNYMEGTTITLTAAPENGYRFVAWMGEASPEQGIIGIGTIDTALIGWEGD